MTKKEDVFTAYMKSLVPGIDKEISDFYDKKIINAPYVFIKEMYPLVKEYCLRDGKRIRPLLVILGYEGYSRFKRKKKSVLKLSSFLEIMHCMFLAQDDIIDKSDLRRGKKALHRITHDKYSKINKTKSIGEDITYVLSDVMFTNSIEFISCSGFSREITNSLLKLFARSYEMTAWGQILDCLYSNPVKVPVKDNIPVTVSILKTAYYTIYFPLMLGYILSGRKNENEKQHLKNFALPLGLAFQIRDDILGTFGSNKDTGKPDDTDIHEGKLTLLVQYTLEAMKKQEQKEFTARLTKEKKTSADIKYIRKTMEKNGAYDKTVEKHRQYIEEAQSQFENLSMKNHEKEILVGLIERISVLE